MKRMWIAVVGVGLVAVVVATCGREVPEASEPAEVAASSDDDRGRRHLELAAHAPELPFDRRDALLEASDQIEQQLEEEGEQDVGTAMRERLREVEVPEAEARAWYDEHRPLFGDRSFDQSRHAVERLLAIQRVREEFGLDGT